MGPEHKLRFWEKRRKIYEETLDAVQEGGSQTVKRQSFPEKRKISEERKQPPIPQQEKKLLESIEQEETSQTKHLTGELNKKSEQLGEQTAKLRERDNAIQQDNIEKNWPPRQGEIPSLLPEDTQREFPGLPIDHMLTREIPAVRPSQEQKGQSQPEKKKGWRWLRRGK